MTNPYDEIVAGGDGKAAAENPYDALVANDDTRLRASAIATRERNPDVYAKANAIAARNNWPVDTVADNLPDFEERERLDKLDQVAKDHPPVADFLADPRRMALTGDDVDGLTNLNKTLGKGPTSLFGKSVYSLFSPLMQGKRGDQLSENLDDFSDVVGASTRSTLNAIGEWIAETERDMAAEPGSGNMAAQVTHSEAERADLAARRARAGAEAEKVVQSYPDNSVGYHVMGVGRSLPVMAGALATRNPALGAAVIGTGTAAEQRSSALAEGATPAAATTSGLVQGSIEAGFDTITLGIAKFGVGPVKDMLVKRFGENVATKLLARASATAPGRLALAAGEGAVTEVPTTLAQMASDEVILDKDYTAQDYALGARDSAIQGAGLSGAAYAGTAPVRMAAQRREDAELGRVVTSTDGAEQLQAFTDAAAAAKLGERSASDLEQFVANAAGDGHVYVAADQARVLFQDQVVLSELVGGPGSLAEQLAAGDVAIPLAKWASVVSRLPNAAEIVKHGRMRADDMSSAELETFDPDALAAELGQDTTEEAAARAEPGAVDPRQQIQDDVMGQLVATERYTPAAAEAQAKLWSAAFSRFGEATGQDAFEIYQRYMGGINDGRNAAQATRPFQGDARLDALIESIRTPEPGNTREIFGPNLSSFLVKKGGVQDQGGELSARDAGKLRPGLVSGAGLDLDGAREAAVEAGYLAEDADVNTFIDALDADLRGNSVYSEQQGNLERQAFELDRQTLLDAISDNDTLRDMPTEDFAKLTNQQIAEALGGATLNQAAVPAESEIESLRARLAEAEAALGQERQMRRTSDLTGLRNKLAFEEDADLGWDGVVAIDLDGLKRMNDQLGHEGADEVLRVVGAQLSREESDSVRFYHRSGDEFAARLEDSEAATGIMQRIQDALEATAIEIDVTGADGQVRSYVVNGAGISYGIAENYETADARATDDKAARLEAGRREDPRKPGPSRRINAMAGDQGRRQGESASGQPQGVEARGIFARAAEAVRNLFQQPNPEGPRGQINIFPDRRMSISLFEKADRSTFIHESGHFFLEVFRDIAGQPGATEQTKADFAALLQWFGVDNGGAIGTEQHEQFARGFEQYLGEGKAPSPDLQSVFSQFKAWILSIYKSLRNLNVELTNDVRGVFDRMLASEEEIEAAHVRQEMQPIARTPEEAAAIGLTDKQFTDYQAMLSAATEEAKAEVLAKLMKAHDRARETWWKEESATVRAEVESELAANVVFRAARILSGARTLHDGTEIPEELRVKLDKAALVATYGEQYLKRISGLYRQSGGVSPADAAMLLGFPSGDDLVKALANRGDLKARIEAETADRMRLRHGDPMTDGTIAEVAMDAVHSTRRIQLMEYEMAVLTALAADPSAVPDLAKPQGAQKAKTERAPLTPETLAAIRAASARRSVESRRLKALSRQVIEGKTPRQIRPNDYLAAERRAARESTVASTKGDYAAALLAKRKQTLNVALYAEARRAQEEFEKHNRYLRKFVTGDKRAKLGKAGADYLEQVDQLLEGLELKPVSAVQVERRERLVEWVRKQEANGVTVNVPQKLLDAAGLTNVRDMTLANLRDVVGTIKQIDHLATLKNKLLLNGELRDRIEVDLEMAASVEASFDAKPERTGDKTWWEKRAQNLDDLDIGRLLPTNIARELDGYKDGGAVWKHIIQPVREAIYGRVLPAVKAMQEGVAALYYAHYSKAEIQRLDEAVFRPEVGDNWSKGRILSLAMNWGSTGNREAILTQAHSRLTEEQAVGLLRTLDERDWKFVQGMVDQVNAYWPEIAETQRRRTGLVPEKVDGLPFVIETVDGQQISVRGGYFPLKYDAERSSYGTTLQELDQIYNDLRVGRTAKAATHNGHTIERVGSGGKTVNLGLDIAQSHMRDVIRDIHLGDAIGYVHNVLHGRDFTEAVIGAGKRDHLKALDLWLKDVAADEMGARSGLETVMKFARQNMTAAVLAWKVTTAGLQFTGLIQTASVIGRRATLHGMTRLLGKSWVGPNSIWNEIRGKSAFMTERLGKVPDAVQAISDARDGKLKAGHTMLLRWGYIPMARMQMIADGASWLAAEAKGLRMFDGDVVKARAFADDIVVRAQSPDNFIDKPALSRGTLGENIRQTELVKSTTMLLSYMMAKGNIAREKYQGTSLKNPLEIAKFSMDMVQLFAIETMIMALLTNGLPDDEDDDGLWDDYSQYLIKEVGLGFLATVPLLSQAATEGRGYDAQSAIERAWSGTVGAVTRLIDNYGEEEDFDRKDAKALVTAAGIATGLPSSQINTTSEALWRVHDGEDVSPIDFLVRPQKPRE